MTNEELAQVLGETVSEVEASLRVGEGQICWRRLWSDPDCGCLTCLKKFPGSVRVE